MSARLTGATGDARGGVAGGLGPIPARAPTSIQPDPPGRSGFELRVELPAGWQPSWRGQADTR